MFVRGVRLIARSVRLHPVPHVAAMSSAILYAVGAIAFTVVLGRLTDDVIVPALDEGATDHDRLVAGLSVLLVIAVLRGAGVVGRRYFGAVAEYRTQRTDRRAVVEHYLGQPLSFHSRRPTGELIGHVDFDMDASTTLLKPLPFSVAVIVLVILSIVSLLVLHPLLAIVGLVLFPALALMNRIYTKHVEGPASRVQDRLSAVAGLVHESVDGVATVKALGLEDDEVLRMAQAAEALRHERLAVGRLRASFEPAIAALPSLGVVALLGLGGWLVSREAISVGDLVAAMTLFSILAVPVQVMGFMLEELPRSVIARGRIDGVLRDAQPPGGGTASVPTGPLGLEVVDLTFGYGEQQVLHGVTLSVPAGAVVALVGSTGAGKSTVMSLLAGLYEPTHGTVRLGGTDLSTVDRSQLAAAVVPVFQESFLFADSVTENIDMGAGHRPAEIAAAADDARADRFIRALPRGYDTVLGERGVTLSGGQRQRIALARALVRRPRVLLLDDATSAVDPRVEADILDRLRSAGLATVVIVAHRLSTIRLADTVVFMSDGRIRAHGRHDELLADPEYEALVRAYDTSAEAIQ